MKSEHEREQLIKDINVLLNQAYDSTLEETYALLKRIDIAIAALRQSLKISKFRPRNMIRKEALE